jgi:MFS family permease
MAGAAWSASGDDASWLWLFAFFVVITIGELYLSPIGLSLVSKVAPVRMVSMMMGVWLSTSFVGNFLAGYLGSFWSSMDKTQFFLMIAAVSAAAGAIIWSFNRPLRGVLDQPYAPPPLAPPPTTDRPTLPPLTTAPLPPIMSPEAAMAAKRRAKNRKRK